MKTWTDPFVPLLPGSNIRCCNAPLNLLARSFKCSVVIRHFIQNGRADRIASPSPHCQDATFVAAMLR